MPGLLINIDVDELDAAERFYTRAFDLHVGRRFGAEGIELVGMEAPIYLLRKPAGTSPFQGARAGRDYQPHWTPVHLDISVEDLDAAVARAASAGATLEAPPRQAAWGTLALMRDPFGHGFCLLQFTAQGYDAISS